MRFSSAICLRLFTVRRPVSRGYIAILDFGSNYIYYIIISTLLKFTNKVLNFIPTPMYPMCWIHFRLG